MFRISIHPLAWYFSHRIHQFVARKHFLSCEYLFFVEKEIKCWQTVSRGTVNAVPQWCWSEGTRQAQLSGAVSWAYLFPVATRSIHYVEAMKRENKYEYGKPDASEKLNDRNNPPKAAKIRLSELSDFSSFIKSASPITGCRSTVFNVSKSESGSFYEGYSCKV